MLAVVDCPPLDALHAWPWLGLGLAIALLVVALVRPMRALASYRARFSDPRWLCWLPLPIYMLHQVEEHGVDLFGHCYAFQAALCATLGSPDTSRCPATPEFIAAVNLGTVWIAGLASGLAGPKRLFACTGMVGLIAVNAILHVVASIRSGHYDPGLLSSLVLFLPVALWTFARLLAQGLVTKRLVALSMAVGAVMHGVLAASVLAAGQGLIGEHTLVAIQLANGFVPLAVSLVISGRPPERGPHGR